MQAKVEIYTWSHCPYSTRAKELLRQKQVEFIEYCIDDDEKKRSQMANRANGRNTLPQIFIGDRHIGGCEDLYTLEDICSLDELLQNNQAIPSLSISEANIEQIQAEYTLKSPQDILKLAFSQFEKIAIAFSGAEDVVLIDMAAKITKNFQVFSLDTGRLHSETYQFLDRVRNHYNIDLEIIFPDTQQVEVFIKEKGLFSFYQDGHKECCSIRKVEPLRRKLINLDAWIVGQRQDQSPNTRDSIPVIQTDTAFSNGDRSLIKFNPLANWTSKQVWNYIRYYQVPYNPLHERGFVSIGCEPCTKTVLPNQHEREGRWWWENATAKECGLHQVNLLGARD
jgi:phosphoadenosine phosphosulfate reductase